MDFFSRRAANRAASLITLARSAPAKPGVHAWQVFASRPQAQARHLLRVSLKSLRAPLHLADQRLRCGRIFQGAVARIEDFGAVSGPHQDYACIGIKAVELC